MPTNEPMKIFSNIETITERFPTPILTMGNFDGVHFGHQYIFRQVRERAQKLGGTSMVFTFDPHPQRILSPEKEFYLINHIEEKIEIIRHIGIDVLICVEFTPEFARQAPRNFVQHVLVGTLHIHEMYLGYDSRFGQGRQGTTEALRQWGQEWGFHVKVIPPIIRDNIVVSSTKIRQLLQQGDIEEAARLLDRDYAIDGTVVPGTQKGSSILHCPTANLEVHHELIPKQGVYIGHVLWRQRLFPAVINIGRKPTFQHDEVTIEAHILDFSATLYGEHLKVYFLRRLRDERSFPHPQALANQIREDIQAARIYFQSLG